MPVGTTVTQQSVKHSRRVVETPAVTVFCEVCFRCPGDEVTSVVHVMNVTRSTSATARISSRVVENKTIFTARTPA